MSSENNAKSRHRAANDRAQDLFLLAKGQYSARDDNLSRAEMARRIVGHHNLHDISKMSLKDTAWVVVKDLFPLIKDAFSDTQMADFLASLGPQVLFGHGNHKEGFYAGLIEAVLEKILLIKVRDMDEGKKWLMPFPEPKPDTFICDIIATQQKHDELYIGAELLANKKSQ